jgi:predicted RNA-binding protein with PUA-like domain
MKHWLFKTEPDTFGIDDLERAPKRATGWEGVRNYQARNLLRDEIKRGDLGFFYHSSCAEPGIAGIVKVVRGGYPDPTSFDRRSEYHDPKSSPDAPRWYAVEVQLQKKIEPLITLDELREHASGALGDMLLLRRGNRLSVTPVSDAEWRFIVGMR